MKYHIDIDEFVLSDMTEHTIADAWQDQVMFGIGYWRLPIELVEIKTPLWFWAE